MNTIKIGRSSECDIILTNDKVSRVHAQLYMNGGQYIYQDMSRNGSNIGGRIITNEKIVVAPGATILLANKVPLPWEQVYRLMPSSGYRANEQETVYQGSSQSISHHRNESYNVSNSMNEDLGIGWGVLAFFIPLAGWIMYFSWKEKTPKRAGQAGAIGIVSFILNMLWFL